MADEHDEQLDDRLERFTRLWMNNQRVVASFITMSLRDSHAAEDVLQEVAVDASRNFHRYDSAKPFGAWLIGIARQRMVDHYRRADKRPLQLSEELEQVLSEAYADYASNVEDRLVALRVCMKRLPERHQELVNQRYGLGVSLADAAAMIGSNAKAVNAMLTRIRKKLADCVEQRLEATQ